MLNTEAREDTNLALRVRTPFAKAATVTSLRAGAELIDAIPPAPQASLLDLVSQYSVEPTTQTVYVLAEAGRPGGASVVPEDTLKNTLSLAIGGYTAPLGVFAAFTKLPRQQLADVAYLTDTVERLTWDGIFIVAWQALLQAALHDNDVPTISGSVRDGQAHVEQQNYLCNAVALNPADWATIEQALPMKMAPVQQLGPGLWVSMYGPMAVISTPLQAAGKALVGDFMGLGLVTQSVLDFTTSVADQNDFILNQATLRGEVMGAAIVTSPKRLVNVTLA